MVVVLANAPQWQAHFNASEVNAKKIAELEQALSRSEETGKLQWGEADNEILSQLDKIELQITTLNKAITNLSKKQYQSSLLISEMSQSVNSNVSASDSTGNRLSTVEKAVSQLHRKQQQASASNISNAGSTGNRLKTVEKAVSRLHQRHQLFKANAETRKKEDIEKLIEAQNVLSDLIDTMGNN